VTYSEEELAHKLGTNPYSFLHVLQRRSPQEDARFSGVRKGYEDFLADGYLVPDAEPHLYLYRQQWAGQTFVGYLGLVSLEDYRAGRIIKHEHTLEAREALFARYLETVGFHAEPVLLTHPPLAELSATAAQIQTTEPLLDGRTPPHGLVRAPWRGCLCHGLPGRQQPAFDFVVPPAHCRTGSRRLGGRSRCHPHGGAPPRTARNWILRLGPPRMVAV
jgi:hypothetical protein